MLLLRPRTQLCYHQIYCMSMLIVFHVTGVCLLSQSESEKHNQVKKPTNLCAAREFLSVCHV